MAMTGGKAYLVKSEHPNYGERAWTIDLYVYVKEESQSAVDNATVLSLGMYVVTPGGAYTIGPWVKTSDSYIGTATNGANCKTFDGAIPNFSGTRWLIENQRITVPHDNDGTKTVPIYWKWGVNSPWGQYVNPSGSFNYTITSIPRKAIVSSAEDFTDEGNPTITFENKGGMLLEPYMNFYYEGKEDAIVYSVNRTKGTYTSPYKFTLTDTEREGIRNAFKDTDRIVVYEGINTYTPSGTRLDGSSKRAICTIINANPIFTSSNISYFDGNSSVTAVTENSSIIVQGKSNVKVTVSATGKKHATISRYEITLNGVTKTLTSAGTVEFGTISSTSTVSVKVIDSRGNYTTATKSISVETYRKPSVLSHPNYGLICRRCDENGALSPSGNYLTVYFKAEWSAFSNHSNNPIITVDVKQSSTLINKVTLTPTTTAGTSTNGYRSSANFESKVNGVTLELTKSYDVVLSCSDEFGEKTPLTFSIPTAETTFHLRKGGMGVGVGMYASEEKVFAIADDWTTKYRGKVVGTILGMGEVELIPEKTNFNELVTAGARCVRTLVNSKTMVNIPIQNAGILYVYSGTGKSGAATEEYSYVRQEYCPMLETGTYCFFVRLGTKTAGSWTFTKWVKFSGTEI